MTTTELIHVGIKGCVLALERRTGTIVWAQRLKGVDFVNLVLEGDRVLATTRGEIFCLDARTGEPVWHNPLRGYGLGLATMAVEDPLRAGVTAALAEKRRREAEAASAAAVTTAT